MMPTDDEIRRTLAEKLMGMKPIEGFYYYGDDTWNPLTNIEQAMMCECKISELGLEYEDLYLEALKDVVNKGCGCADKWSRWEFKLIHATAEQRSRACYEAIKEG